MGENDEATRGMREPASGPPPTAQARRAPRDRPGEPMPGEANPTSDPRGRPLDRRKRSP